MIIEAAPRLRDGPLEGYTPSPNKSELGTTHLQLKASTEKNHYRLGQPSIVSERKSLRDREKTRADLLERERTPFYTKNRRASYRGHPYDREGKERRSGNKRNFLLSAFFNHKCPSLFRSLPRDKAGLFQKFSPNLKRKFEKQEGKIGSIFTPIFTANANENNDNCAVATHRSEGFAVTNPSPVTDNICDVEIEDLTTTAHNALSSQETDTWRQRRKSFNTNPLSTTSGSLDKPPSLLYLDNFLPRDSDTSRELTKANPSRDLFHVFSTSSAKKGNWCSADRRWKPRPHKDFFGNSAEREEKKVISDTRHNTERTENLTPSIEKLVEFFESNSAAIHSCSTARKNIFERQLPSPEIGRQQEATSVNLSKRTSFFRQSASQQNVESHHQLRRPSSSPSTGYQTRTSPVYFAQYLTSDWDSAIPVSSSGRQSNITSTVAGGVFNNNGNAASAPADSKFFLPGSQFNLDQFPPIGRYENHRKAPSCHSPVFFLSDRGRCASSLACASPDIELGDLESNRLSAWVGLGSTAFERRHQESAGHFDNLIDLQTTSKRPDWLRTKDSYLATPRQSVEGSTYKQNLQKNVDKSGDRFRSSLCQLSGRENKAACLSANNHHNAPWSGSEEKLFHERIRERNSFENFQLHHTLLNPFLRKRPDFLNSDPNDMGCIQSIAKAKVSPDRCHHSVIVEDIQAAIDRTPTEIEEKSPIVLRYRTPYFRASAHVIVPPIPRKETWTVGWIQACDSMKFINQYGNLGSSSWEIPALKDRRITAVSDSDGVSYPWYGNTTEIATVEGPTDTSRSLTLRMNDNFYPSVTWDIPVSEGSEAHLTHIVRDQSFTTWLAAVNQTTGRLEVLRTVKWHFYLEIDVDPTQELGKRARIVSPLVQKQPIVLKNNSEPVYISSPHRTNGSGSAASRQKRLNRRPGAGGDNNSNNHTNFIPKSALIRPSANNAQTLIWRPTRDVPVIVVPAKEEYKENNEVVWFTRTPTVQGHDHNVRVLSLQEMSQIKKTIS